MKKDEFIAKRDDFADEIGLPNLYEYIDQFALYAGTHTIGNKLFTYDLFRRSVGVPGDIVEFGCWKGANLMYLAKLKSLLEPHAPKKLYGFDNFSGLPEAGSEDGDYANKQVGRYHGSEGVLRSAISLFEFDNAIELVVGDARETIPPFRDAHKEMIISFAWLDFDLYEPTRVALDFLEDCISVGGVIVFDEACTQGWPGETLAMKEFLKTSKHKFEMISNSLSRQPTVALIRVL